MSTPIIPTVTNKSVYQKRKDISLSLAVCFLLSYRAIILFISTVTDYVFAPTSIDTWICYIAMLVVLITAYIYCLNTKSLLFMGSILLVYLMTYWFFNDNQRYMFTSWGDLLDNPLYVFIIYSLSTYIFIRQLVDFSCFEKIFLRFSVIVVCGDLIAAIILANHGIFVEYMTYSYNMLPHVIFLILVSFKYSKKRRYLVFGVAGLAGIFVFGARGALTTALVSIVLYLFFEVKGNKKIWLLITIIGMAFVLIFFYQNIISGISDMLTSMNIDSRTFDKLLSDNFFTSNTRIKIYKSVLSNIDIMPKGLFADRIYSGSAYAHDIFLEVWLEYGYLFGSILLIIMLYIIAKAIFDKNNEFRYLSYIFLAAGFMKLFVTGSYLSQEPCFYVILALGVNAFSNKRFKLSYLRTNSISNLNEK